MLKIGICDDIAQQLLAQEKMVRDIMLRLCVNAEVKCFKSGEDLLCEIEQKGDMDLILLDIEMGGINGVEAARIIREKDSRAILIFISSHDQYFREMISVQPFAFIDKPVLQEQLEAALKRAIRVLGEKEELFEYAYKKVFYKIPIRKIRYFESDKRKIYIHGTEEMNTFYKKLDEVEKQLARMDAKFLRISKSYLINASHIREFRYEKIVMDDGRELSIGSGYKGKIRQSYMELMQES